MRKTTLLRVSYKQLKILGKLSILEDIQYCRQKQEELTQINVLIHFPEMES